MRVLLVQPPFWAVNSPSIGLSYLKGALNDAGIEADILYSNLDFAAAIGREIYGVVQSQLPVDLLFGDLIFGPSLQGGPVEAEPVRVMLEGVLSAHGLARSVPEGVLDRYTELTESAIRFVDAFKAEQPWLGYDLVGFSTTFSLVPALAMAKALKSSPGAPPVVFGGCHCEGSLGEALMRHFPWIDYVARGDGEALIVSLARQFSAAQANLRSVDGLLWKEGGLLGRADRDRALATDLDHLPVPDYADWLSRLESLGWKNLETLKLPIETSRGCWYGQRRQCTFCGLNGAGLDFRTKSPDRILQEYAELVEHGIPVIYAVDSVLDPKYFRTLIPRIEALPRNAVMFFEVRATHTRDQLLALRNAGIRVLQPGIESLDTRLLKLMNKGTTAFQNVRMLRWAAELSLPIAWNILCGLPGERPDDYEKMTKLVRSLVHLIPPITECNRIHVDRFSPLFDKHQHDIEPISSYAFALGLEPSKIRELAYHFHFTDLFPTMSSSVKAIKHLRRTVLDWRECVGSTSFVKVERQGMIWLYDNRPDAVIEACRLEGVEARAYRAMENGCTREYLRAELYTEPSVLENMIERFLDNGWIAELDGKYLCLAVSVDDDVPDELPIELQGSVATALYQHRLTQLWKAVTS